LWVDLLMLATMRAREMLQATMGEHPIMSYLGRTSTRPTLETVALATLASWVTVVVAMVLMLLNTGAIPTVDVFKIFWARYSTATRSREGVMRFAFQRFVDSQYDHKILPFLVSVPEVVDTRL
jgi:hypothetical protein